MAYLLKLVSLALTVALIVEGVELCDREPECGGTCYATCDNTCECDQSEMVTYGGNCLEQGFCEEEFLHMEDCVEEGGPSCPTNMVSTEQLLHSFTRYHFRIDVRTIEEWDEGHANMSIHTPGLSKNPASNYLDKIGGLEDRHILVYCRSGGRAFAASQNLLRYGFKDINSFYHGGFPNVAAAITEQSEKSGSHPNKNYCYITGESDICPTPLPLSHIKSADDIAALGDNIVLVDVRPKREPYLHSLKNAERIPNKPKKIAKFLKTVADDATIVVFCAEGTLAFHAAKAMRETFKGKLVWIDNGGYEDVKKIKGIQKL